MIVMIQNGRWLLMSCFIHNNQYKLCYLVPQGVEIVVVRYKLCGDSVVHTATSSKLKMYFTSLIIQNGRHANIIA